MKRKILSIVTTFMMLCSFIGLMPVMEVGALSMTYTPTNGFKSSKYYSQLTSVSLTGDQRANLVNVAKSQIGYHEGNNFEQYGGGSSGSDNVTEYNYWYYGQKHVKGNDTYPWCAVFVSWCAKQAGLSNIIPSFAGCGTGYNSTLPGAGAKTYLRSSGYTPQSGDIIFFNSGGYSPGHVGIVNYVSNGYVYTIEGNSSNKVNTLSYALSNTKIYGYAVPNYSNIKNWYDDYSIVDLGTGFCATISNSTTGGYLNNEGWNVSSYPGNDQKNQAWIFNQQSDGSYTITSMLDTARLTTCDHNNGNGASIVVSHDGVDLAQKWYIYKNKEKGYILRPLHSDRVMDLDGGGYAAGTNIQLYEYNDTISQYYNINKIDWRNMLSPSDIGTNFCAYIYNNTTGGYLDNEGWNVAAYPGHGGISQIFYFDKQNDGSYIISSLLDNARLTTCDGEYNNKSSIVVTHDEINQSQKWYIYETTREYIFRPLQSDKVMDLDGGGYAAGTNIQLYEYNSTFPQYYSIKKVDYNLTINFDSNNGICSLGNKVISYKNTYGTLPIPTRTGYTFEGWYTEKDGGIKIISDTIVTATSDQTLYAHWNKISYDVYFDPNGGKSDASCLSIYYNSTYDELANASREGYKFLGWYTEKEGGTLVTNDTVYKLTTDQTLYAHWEKINLKGDLNNDDSIAVSDVVLLQQYLSKKKEFTSAQPDVADMNNDGVVNVFDVIILKRMLLI